MAELRQGDVTVTIPDHITIPPKAGSLSPDDSQRLTKARKGVGLTCESTAEVMKKNPERLAVPQVTPDSLAASGRVAEDIDGVIGDVETLLLILKQANSLLDAEAHNNLRRVLAFVRGQEKFDPHLADLVPALIAYFSRERPKPDGGPTP
jgi:hypothetical protein